MLASLFWSLIGSIYTPAGADERAALAELRATTLELVRLLVAQGVLTQAQADAMRREAEQAGNDAAAASPPMGAAEPVDPDTVRVPYVPEFVREEIKNQVRDELRQDVAKEVIRKAKTERWGVPGALPAWVSRLQIKGDVRLRGEGIEFAEDNVAQSYFDWLAINDAGGLGAAGLDAFLNTTEDRQRLRVRARLGVEAAFGDNWLAGLRLSTGNLRDPVSTNQTLGNTGNRYQAQWDEVYLRYDARTEQGFSWLTAVGGRMPNPFLSTDLVYDPDLGFEGVYATLRWPYSRFFAADKNTGHAFLTAGAFPLQELEISTDDKWLFGAQLGTRFGRLAGTRLGLGLAYYDYAQVKAQPNPLGSRVNDFTAPQFLQQGNSLARISNDIGENPADPRLVGLAADFDIANATATLDFGHFEPVHVVLALDYARNVGFDENDILQRTGIDLEERTTSYQARLTVGYPVLDRRHEWQLFGGYKRLEADSVLDAFTDSDFHLGGTDAKGWLAGGGYGLADNTWLQLRWLSADEIDNPPLGIDVLQVDLNAAF